MYKSSLAIGVVAIGGTNLFSDSDFNKLSPLKQRQPLQFAGILLAMPTN